METATNATADEFRAAREASGPPDVSLWRVLRGYRADPLRRWTEIREQHGDVARYRFAGIDTFFIASADGARRVLQDNAANYTKEHASYRMLRRLFGNGLLLGGPAAVHRQQLLDDGVGAGAGDAGAEVRAAARRRATAGDGVSGARAAGR